MDKITWITGAGSGIGKALVEKLSEERKVLAISGRRENLLKELSDKLQNVSSFPLDVSGRTDVFKTYNKISELGDVECLINNAGSVDFNLVEKQSVETIESMVNINLMGSIYTIKSVLPGMIERKEGTIINIISVVTEKIFLNSAAYTAAKLGLMGFLDVLREEVRKHNIKIVNILPGATSTPIWDEKLRSKFAERMMNAKDVAETIRGLLKLKGSAVPEKIVLRSIYGDL